MSRVHMDPSIITTIQEEEAQSLSSEALAEHERQHSPLSCARHPKGRRGTVDVSSSDKSSEMEQRRLRRMSRRAVEVTRRLSVSSALFSQLHGLLAKHEGDGEPRYENTYRVEPKEDEKFMAKEVSAIIERVLDEKLSGVGYDATSCGRLCCSLSNIIRSRIHENLELPRYKLVVHVAIGERKDQSLQVASRCLWNQATDRYASGSYQNRDLFAVATVYGMYFD
ncbi:hypothetical protein LSH36_5g15007 [Paralvinella palmiformis]|uniref:Uncharacterized protein n=1 Tax=Paralvinella palmiformis TaxID=53620 RepID=A0AAD9NH95_9ANNE|nr:hypothetical protein LSH36_5g15007 [Paralvinella palmiformis]